MKQIAQILKIVVISAILYFFVSIFFVNPFFVIGPVSLIVSNIITIVVIVLLVAHLLKRDDKGTQSNSQQITFPKNEPKTVFITIVSIVIVAFTLFIPTASNSQMAGLVYLVALPLMIVGLILTGLFNKKYKTTSNQKYKTAAIITLIFWAFFLLVLYSQFIPGVSDYLHRI